MKIAWRQILAEWKEKGKGRRLPSIPKDEFPRLLNSLMTRLDEKSSDNLKAGFRKAGIWPLDKSQILSRLPSTASSEPESNATCELVSQSFVDHLRQARGDDEASCNARAKRRRVAVAPGKSLSADDIPLSLLSRATAAKQTSGTCTDKRHTSKGTGTNVAAPVASTSAADESDMTTMSETETSSTGISANDGSPCTGI